MSYRNAKSILPAEVLTMLQAYVEGETIYIPKKAENKRAWGEGTAAKGLFQTRNIKIYQDYLSGMRQGALAQKYYLSVKRIQGILLEQKRNT